MIRRLSALLILLLTSPAIAQAPNIPPGYALSVANSGIPGIDGHVLFYNAPSAWDPVQSLQVRRYINSGTGTPGWTYNALYANCTTNALNQGYEWCGTFESHNTARLSTGAQNVAINGTMWRDPTGTGEATGHSWGLNGNCVDTTGESPPTGACIGAEIDVGGAIGPDPNRQRVIIHAAGGGQPGSHVGYGVMVSPTPGTTIDRAFSTANVDGQFGIGLDLAGGVFGGPAIALAKGQWLAFDADQDGNFSRFLGINPADGMFTYMTKYGPMLRFSDEGAAYVGRLVQTIPHVPASVNALCEAGEQAWDANAIYVCIAPNRWKRAALSDW